jgi:glucose/arabinose dehydrogenase
VRGSLPPAFSLAFVSLALTVALAHGSPDRSNHAPVGPVRVERAFPEAFFDEPVFLTHAGDGSGRVFVVEQDGRILSIAGEQTQPEPYLDITARVNRGGPEEGLLGLAFDPSFASNGRLFVYYSAANPRRSVVSRFTASGQDAVDPSTELVLLEVPQPFRNHNGGMIAFGPDGMLYIALGDGGLGDDPLGNGQNTGTLLGSILRIDVSMATAEAPYAVPGDNPFVGAGVARPEIWAYGLRNPWRFSFDEATGDLWAADVGQDDFEEVEVIRRGLNYGWNTMEGSHCFQRATCDRSGLELPVAEYDHGLGCSIIGGYVYRGDRVPSLAGAYVYADFCSGRIWALRYDGERAGPVVELANVDFPVPSFGVDERGELFILGLDGAVHRFVDEAEPLPRAADPTAVPTATPTSARTAPAATVAPPVSAPTPTATAAPPPTGDSPSSGTNAAAWGVVVFALVGIAGAVLVYLVRRGERGTGTNT